MQYPGLTPFGGTAGADRLTSQLTPGSQHSPVSLEQRKMQLIQSMVSGQPRGQMPAPFMGLPIPGVGNLSGPIFGKPLLGAQGTTPMATGSGLSNPYQVMSMGQIGLALGNFAGGGR